MFCSSQVGAVNAHIMSVPWLSVRAIDLRPCLPSIEQADFLDLAAAAEYDVVVCCMVLNCVPTAAKRGSMLIQIRQHLRQGGHAFIVIPLRCLTDSPYMTSRHFEAAMQAAGFQVSHTSSLPNLVVEIFSSRCMNPILHSLAHRLYLQLNCTPQHAVFLCFALLYNPSYSLGLSTHIKQLNANVTRHVICL